jgi:putative ABC transport system permease protein
VNIEGFYLLEGHAKAPAQGGEEIQGTGHKHAIQPLPEELREVTAILVLLKNDLFSQSVYTAVNEGSVAQAVYPSREIIKFFATFLAPVRVVLLAMTVLIVVVASVGILVSIYNSMSERRREIAVMRALGAGRATVMTVILLESILLSLVAGLAGLVLGHAAMALVSPYVVERAGVAIGFLQYQRNELILIPGLVILAALAGLLPAVAAYRTDVARSLSANP